jgi:hypothetical protein
VPLGFLIRRTGTEPHRVNRICLSSDRAGCDETSQCMMLSRSLRDPRVMSITSNLLPLQKVGSFPRFRISNFEKFHLGLPSTVAIGAAPYTMMCNGIAPHN